MGRLAERAKKELREFIPAMLYFLTAFELLALTQDLMLTKVGGGPGAYFGAAVGGLLVAKVVLVVDHFPFMRRFAGRPMIYAVAWSTIVYFLVAAFVRYVEHVVRLWGSAGGFEQANRQIFHLGEAPRALMVYIWLFVLLVVFCTFREVVRSTGHRDLLELLLARRRERIASEEAAAKTTDRARRS